MRTTAVKRRKAILSALLAASPGGLDVGNLCRATFMRAGRLYPILDSLIRDRLVRREQAGDRAMYYFVKVKEEDESTAV